MNPTAQYLAELEESRALRATGWLYTDPAEHWDPDLAADLCLACGQLRSLEGHDPCISNLPGVRFACCGHGRPGRCVYVSGYPFGALYGPAAARKMRELGGHPPAAAFLLDPIGEAP